jgi:hypothetical protein
LSEAGACCYRWRALAASDDGFRRMAAVDAVCTMCLYQWNLPGANFLPQVQWRRSLHVGETSPGRISRKERKAIQEDIIVTRNVLEYLGHSHHEEVLEENGIYNRHAPPHPQKRGIEASHDKTQCLEKDGFRTDLMIAAAAVYQMSYAPKGKINDLDTKEWSVLRKRNLRWGFLFAGLGIVLAAYQNEVLWANNRNPNGTTLMLKCVQLATSGIGIWHLRCYYQAIIALERLRGLPMHNGDVSVLNLQACGLYWQALVDLLCMLPQPIPFLNTEFEVYNSAFEGSCMYQLDSLLVVAMFMRIRLIPRFYGECVSDIGNEIARAYGNISRVTIGDSFIFKYLITSSLGMVLMLWVTQVIFFGYCLMIFERPMSFNELAHSKLHEFANCVWCAVITMTIVGYGDVYPLTFLGRWAMITASISALIMVAITTNIVRVYLTQSRAEAKCVEVLTCLDLRDEVKVKAAELIQATWRGYTKPLHRGGRRRGQSWETRAGTKVAYSHTVGKAVWDFIAAQRSYKSHLQDVMSDEQTMVAASQAHATRTLGELQITRIKMAEVIAALKEYVEGPEEEPRLRAAQKPARSN